MRELDELVALIPTVRAPALLLADPKDTVVPVHTARRLAHGLPNGRLQLIEGAGHHLPRRAPGAVSGAITAFLAATIPLAMTWARDGVPIRVPGVRQAGRRLGRG